jgi:hypothetical protein
MSIVEIKRVVNEMPETATIDDVLDRLIFIKQLEDAQTEIDEGKGISHQEVKRRFTEKWLKA